MTAFSIDAPAKLNLSLRVVGKRPDGFHDIDSLMVKLPALADELEFCPSDGFSFVCETEGVPTDESNLVVRAVRRFEEASGLPCNFQITLTKRIPHGAGLGGGSSDAASTLIGLNRAHSGILSEDQLSMLAAGLGSDVPFFLGGDAARCRGRGELIEPATVRPLRVLLFKPGFFVSTPEAYGRWQESRELPGVSYAEQPAGDLSLVNDLERPVFEKYRFLPELKRWLLARQESVAALMSGSGSTVFAVLRDNADAEAVASAAKLELDPGLWHWAGSTAG